MKWLEWLRIERGVKARRGVAPTRGGMAMEQVRGMSEGLKTYPPVDLHSRFRAFRVVTALPFVRRWVPRGGSLVLRASVSVVKLIFFNSTIVFKMPFFRFSGLAFTQNCSRCWSLPAFTMVSQALPELTMSWSKAVLPSGNKRS